MNNSSRLDQPSSETGIKMPNRRYFRSSIDELELLFESAKDNRDLLDVVTIEQPPRGEIEALERWRIARRDFLAKLKNVEALQKQAQAAYEAITQRPEAARRVADVTCRWQKAKQSYAAALDRGELTKRLHARAVDAERRAAEDRTTIDRLRPGFFARLFNLRSYREWCIQMTAAQSALSNARMELKSTAITSSAILGSRRPCIVPSPAVM